MLDNSITMIRKEEILEKACEFVDKRYQDVGILTTHEASVAACQDMAEWADAHPNYPDARTMFLKVCYFLEQKELLKDFDWGILSKEFENYFLEK